MTRYAKLTVIRRLDQESYRRWGYTGEEITIKSITEMATAAMLYKWRGHAGKDITINIIDIATATAPILIQSST